jgi:hypothetical protein
MVVLSHQENSLIALWMKSVKATRMVADVAQVMAVLLAPLGQHDGSFPHLTSALGRLLLFVVIQIAFVACFGG